MRSFALPSLALLLLAACGGSPDDDDFDAGRDGGPVDAGDGGSAGVDAGDAGDGGSAGVDAGDGDAGCTPTLLLDGTTDVAAQGWSVVSQGSNTLSYDAGEVVLTTSTAVGASSGGQLLLAYADAVPTNAPFAFEVVMRVDAVNAHNALDAAASLLGSFTPPFGLGPDRERMVYLDAAAIGWADESQSFAFDVLDGAFHTYVFASDGAGHATVGVDGVAALSRDDFATNGTIAIGDHTNDANVDSTLRVRSVRLLCP